MSRDSILITSLYELFVDRPIKNCLASNNAAQVVVYVVMRADIYPRKRASRDIVFVKFLEDFGVELYEQNSKSFDLSPNKSPTRQ